MKAELRKLCLATACASGVLMSAAPVQAANWLMLQGVERPNATHRFWGFAQPSYTVDRSDNLSGLVGPLAANNGKRLANTTIAPYFKNEDSRLHLRRLRFGWRGKFTGAMRTPFTAKMNYFAFFETAPNLMTYKPFGDRSRGIALDHASVTFNHIKGARIRAGLFKTPGPEETFQAIHTFNYIEFTDFIAREQLERFVTGAVLPPTPGGRTIGTPATTSYGINAARDWGVQVFDRFKTGKWDYSYAVMLGRGEAISTTSSSNPTPELYLYASAEYDLPGGRGPFKNGIKLFGWYQKGKRQFASDATATEYDRKRYGIGVTALGRLFGGKYKHRLGFELMYADGMIFLAPSGNVAGGTLQYAPDKGNKSRGITLDYGFYLNRKWRFDIRYDRHNLLYKTASNIHAGNERVITGTTFGVNYNINKRTRLTFNYIKRKAKAPVAYPAAALTNDVRTTVGTLGDRMALQLTWMF